MWSGGEPTQQRGLGHGEKAPTGLVGIVGQGPRAGYESRWLCGSAGRPGEVGRLAMMERASNVSTRRDSGRRAAQENGQQARSRAK